jgi:2-phosphosulfolactate phosphatase
LILATTNGTVALVRSKQAAEVLAGSLVNADAVVKHLMRFHCNRTVLLVCSGSTGRINLEDMYGAGHMVSLLRAMPGAKTFTDAALAAEMVYLQGHQRPLGTGHPLWQSSVGQYMARKGHAEDVAYAARESAIDIVPKLQADGRVVAA